MRFQVPQFVDIEDRIIGPLTLKQFLAYVIAIMLLVPLFPLVDLSLFVTLAIPILGTAALFAHFHYNGKSLFSLVGQAAGFYASGRFFLWRRVEGAKPLQIAGEELAVAPEIELAKAPALSAVAQALETEGNVRTEDEVDPLTGEEATVISQVESRSKQLDRRLIGNAPTPGDDLEKPQADSQTALPQPPPNQPPADV